MDSLPQMIYRAEVVDPMFGTVSRIDTGNMELMIQWLGEMIALSYVSGKVVKVRMEDRNG